MHDSRCTIVIDYLPAFYRGWREAMLLPRNRAMRQI
jgi:hypothetical protein